MFEYCALIKKCFKMADFEFFQFKWKYELSWFLGKFIKSHPLNNQILFVTHTSTRGWILDTKACRLSKNYPGESKVFYSKRFTNLPDAEGYFFLHQKYFARAIRYNPRIRKRKTIVMFTHPEWSKRYSIRHIVYILNFADRIVCLNYAMAEELSSLGIPREKIVVLHLASDPEMFTPRERDGKGAIGFCMGYYKRKNPELIIDIVKNMPDKKFLLIGRNWDQYERFNEILSFPNFEYYDNIPYERYPEIYHKMDVFVSTSYLEGGPVPLLEAMLCNVVPVVTRTGFCSDLVEHGKNGYLFDSTDNVQHVIQLIREAIDLKINVRPYAEPHSWQNYANKIRELFINIPDKFSQ
jgi:glycosyltransferase involved in cell wall biosynthesis